MEELRLAYYREKGKDKNRLRLYRMRGAPGQISAWCRGVAGPNGLKSDGKMGLMWCSNPGCFNAEDGQVAFARCGACKTKSYCSRDCQKMHWPEHKRECRDKKKEHKQWKEAKKESRMMSNMMMNLVGGMHGKK